MTHKTVNTLSIGVNRQRVGFAVFTHGELEHVTGRALPPRASRSGRKELLGFAADLIGRYRIGVVTMPRLTVQQRDSRAVARANKHIQTWAIRSGLTLVIQSSHKRKEIGTDQDLATRYPELRQFLGETAWERRYYKHIFKAVSAGVAFLQERENERGSE